MTCPRTRTAWSCSSCASRWGRGHKGGRGGGPATLPLPPPTVAVPPLAVADLGVCVLPAPPQIDYWKEQAGLPPHKRDYVDLEEIADSKQNGARAGLHLGGQPVLRCWAAAAAYAAGALLLSCIRCWLFRSLTACLSMPPPCRPGWWLGVSSSSTPLLLPNLPMVFV